MNKKERICILGGGPSGIAAAMYLQVKGYENVEIFEKEAKVGGKTRLSWNFYGADTYHAVRELERFGGTDHAFTIALRRDFRNLDGSETDSLGNAKRRMISGLFGTVKLNGQVRKLARLLETKYRGYDTYGHIGLSRGEFFGLSKEMDNHLRRVRGKNRNLKDLALPFAQFCRINGVEEAAKLWLTPMAAAGIGLADEIPAAFVLKRFDLETVTAFHGMTLHEWENGAEEIFEAVQRRLHGPVRLKAEVLRVKREEASVLVTVRDGNGEREEVFDRLLVTTSLDAFAKLADVSKEEGDLFARIRSPKAAHVLFRAAAKDISLGEGYVPENIRPERLGHLTAFQWLGQPSEESTLAARANLSFEGSSEASLEEAAGRMEEELARFGIDVKERLSVETVSGTPFLTCADYADGWHDRLEALQGIRRTYYTGEILSAGSMEDTCAIARDLVGRFF